MFERNSVPRSGLFEKFRQLQDGRVVMLLDTCFSGKIPSDTDPKALKGLQPYQMVVKPDVVRAWSKSRPSNVVELTAGTHDQYAGPLPGAQRPAFSYLVLGALRGWGETADGDQRVLASEAVAYANRKLGGLVHNRKQTPQRYGDDVALSPVLAAIEKEPDIDSGTPPKPHGPDRDDLKEVEEQPGPPSPAAPVALRTAVITVRAEDHEGRALTDQEGAEVFVDGRQEGTTPVTIRVAPGEHRFFVRKKFHKPKKVSFPVKHGKITEYTAKLEPNFGFLSVTSTPAGGALFVDDLRVGLTPQKIQLRVGRYRVRIEQPRRLPFRTTTAVKLLETTEVKAELTENYGALRILSYPTRSVQPSCSTARRSARLHCISKTSKPAATT